MNKRNSKNNQKRLDKYLAKRDNRDKSKSTTRGDLECSCECTGGAVGGSTIECARYHNITCESSCSNCITMNYSTDNSQGEGSFICNWDGNPNTSFAPPWGGWEPYMDSEECENWIEFYFRKLAEDKPSYTSNTGYDEDNWPAVISCKQFCDWFACFDSTLNWTQFQNCDYGTHQCGSYGCTIPGACNYDPTATIHDGECLWDDCAGVCGGPLEYDACGICGGDSILYPCWNEQNYCNPDDCPPHPIPRGKKEKWIR